LKKVARPQNNTQKINGTKKEGLDGLTVDWDNSFCCPVKFACYPASQIAINNRELLKTYFLTN
jgi:hypothetical protein